ncbi:MAG: UDP-N-acetylglucosamine 1-carboxyvinyltransferase [Nitrososphaerales archaeon]|nr:UDP-N-acetylglucosamine 1-carboxyvinyltransferase [Nitrososphaerales archaeon]
MEQFVIEGGHPLKGEITASGNKNAALKMLPACLLTDEPVTLYNVPDIADVRVTAEILQHLGVDITQVDPHTWLVHARELRLTRIPPEQARLIRSSIVLAGPLLARTGRLELPIPGGDVIGRRRLDTHVLALEKLGAHIDFERGAFKMNADSLHGADILLDEASVTATENAIMAAVLARGTTVIRNAASEPHVQNLCHMLSAMGAQIDGIGSNCLTIQGVDRLSGGEHRVGADYLEVGSFIGAAAVTGGAITIREADPQHLDMIGLVFAKLGVRWEVRGHDIFIPSGQELTIRRDLGNRIPTIKAQPWPAFPSDLMSIALTVATQAAGSVLLHEWMYDGRFFFTDKLVSMGARIVLCDPHRALVYGPTALHGVSDISSPDIRAGMSILLAALAARGTTTIHNVRQIDRGYERVEEKLAALGAHIERVTD